MAPLRTTELCDGSETYKTAATEYVASTEITLAPSNADQQIRASVKRTRLWLQAKRSYRSTRRWLLTLLHAFPGPSSRVS